MKKIIFLILLVAIFLCSCSSKKDIDYLEFPKTKWGMTMDEALNAYGITEKDGLDYYEEGSVFVIKDYKLFDEKTSKITFNFIDLKDGNPVLCAVNVTYPENTDMSKVLKKMQKAYGEMISDISIYDLYQVHDDIMTDKKYSESEHLKLWADKSVIELIPENEINNYRDEWKNYQPRLSDENWDIFSKNARMVTVVWSNDGEFPSLEKNSLSFNAYNLVVYNELKSRLSHQE